MPTVFSLAIPNPNVLSSRHLQTFTDGYFPRSSSEVITMSISAEVRLASRVLRHELEAIRAHWT
jgi:hypothetical protein